MITMETKPNSYFLIGVNYTFLTIIIDYSYPSVLILSGQKNIWHLKKIMQHNINTIEINTTEFAIFKLFPNEIAK